MKSFFLTLFAVSTLMANNTVTTSMPHLNEVMDKAKAVRAEAAEVAKALRSKQADLAKVQEQVRTLDSHAEALRESVNRLEAENPNLNDRQKAEVKRIREIVEVVNIFVDNKMNLLQRADAQKQRNLIRAKAEGVVMRTDLVTKSAQRMAS